MPIEESKNQDGQREKRAGDGRDSQRPKGQYIRERDLTDRLEYVRTIRATAEAPVPLSLRSNVVAMLLRACTRELSAPRRPIDTVLPFSYPGKIG